MKLILLLTASCLANSVRSQRFIFKGNKYLFKKRATLRFSGASHLLTVLFITCLCSSAQPVWAQEELLGLASAGLVLEVTALALTFRRPSPNPGTRLRVT
jgi:hypothetical protein